MRKIQAGNYTFVSKPSKFTQLTSATNILLDNLKGSTVNYTKAPLPNITTDKFVLAVDSPDDSHRYTLYAYEDTTSPIGITVSEGWWWFNSNTNQLVSIDPPTIPIKSDCTLLSTVSDEEYNALFTEPFIVEAPKEYKRVWSQGQRDTNINDFEAMPEVNPNMSYNITDYPNTGITNEQMIKVLTTNRLFSNSEAFICLDDGTYQKGHIYKLNIVNDSKSWEDITKGLKIYTITENLNHDGIKSGTFTEEQMNNIRQADILQVYAIDGYPVYKYAYKGLFPTNSAQSTINANLYFAVATEKGNYVLAIDMTTRNWKVREPESTPAIGTNIQVTELPPASAENVGKIVQFITEKEEGEELVQGHWYKCKPVVADEGRYEWVKQSVQDKDYIVNTSDRYSSSLENVGRMVYQDSGRNIYWIPYIALGELAQLVNYQGNITLHYTIEDDSYPSGLTKSDEMVWHADFNGWISTATTGFYAISKQADMFGSETLTKPLYTATYMGNDLVVTSRKITVTSIDLANGTSITIPTGYGEAKFYNYSINAGYSSPIDFYSKFGSDNLTDADIEAFKFMAVNQVTVTFDINKLNIETENGLEPLKDYLGGSPLFKHELVIPYSFSVGDSETVNGSVTYHYLSNTGTQITNASEIDDNFLLSGGIGKNNGSDALTWVINEKPYSGSSMPDKHFIINFTSNAIKYTSINLSPTDAFTGEEKNQIIYRQEDGNLDQVYEIYQGTEQWINQNWRTVTFETAPTGELLTWLQANAVPQGGASPTTVLLLNITVTKAGSSITVEAVNASTMGYITGTVGTITDTVTQLI